MENVSPTRMELLAVKAQIGLAEQGRDLLKEKRNALLKEFMKIADAILRSSEEREHAATEAQRTLARADALDGPEAVRRAERVVAVGRRRVRDGRAGAGHRAEERGAR